MGAEMPIISFICVALILILLPLYWKTHNIALLSTIIWLVICNIIHGVNNTVWVGSTVVKCKIWCDISSRLMIGANFGLPASVFCICCSLAQIASPRSSTFNASEKRRRMIFELAMCVGLPIVIMALYYVVQTNRFDVYEDFGCDLPHDMSILALFIVYIPPVIVSLGALICAGISLHGFINAHRRIRVRETLQSSQSGITTGLYLRFTIFSIIQMFYTITLTLFLLIISVIPGLNSWSDWDDVHADWQQIEQIARADIPQSSWNEYIFVWYMIPMSSLLFFAFFGLSQDARMEYVNFFRWIFRLKPKPASAPPTSAPRAENFYTTSLSFRTSPVAIIQTGTTELVTPAVHGAQDHMPASTSSRVPPPTIS